MAHDAGESGEEQPAPRIRGASGVSRGDLLRDQPPRLVAAAAMVDAK
ncbi:hypothetical protein BJ973_007795 [Actinoplanes tereljensis]